MACLSRTSSTTTKMTDEERSAISSYLLVSEYVNDVLRGVRPMNEQVSQWIDRIRSGLRRYTVPATGHVTREVDMGVFPLVGDMAVEGLLGQVFQEPGFLSTSMLETPSAVPHGAVHRPFWI